jgi:hypothetical protein
MPPRFAYWTILIDDKPTAFRARDKEELLPTFTQLKRTNQNVTVRWFAQGQLWDSPEAQRAAGRKPKFAGDKRGPDWRPGGSHKDPRDRFKKKNRPERAWSDGDASRRRDRDTLGPPREPRTWHDKPAGPPLAKPPSPGGGGRPRTDQTGPARPWTSKPRDPSRPWSGKPRDPSKPWSAKPRDPSKPWSGKPRDPSKPWSGKPRDPSRPTTGAKPRGPARPWGAKPGGPSEPRRDRPQDRDRKPFRPDGSTSRARSDSNAPRKRRDDEPPDRS